MKFVILDAYPPKKYRGSCLDGLRRSRIQPTCPAEPVDRGAVVEEMLWGIDVSSRMRVRSPLGHVAVVTGSYTLLPADVDRTSPGPADHGILESSCDIDPVRHVSLDSRGFRSFGC